MNVSAALFTHCSIEFTIAEGDNTVSPSVPRSRAISKGKTFSHEFKGLEPCIHSVNRACQSLVDNQNFFVRTCRRFSSGLFGVVNNQYVVGFLSNRLSIDLKDRRSTPLSYFQVLIDSDNYHYLTDPIDIKACEKLMEVSFYGYGFKAGFSAVASAVVGYQGSDAQKIIDVIYETSDSFSPFPQVHKACVKYLYRICSLHDLPPGAMQIELSDNPAGAAHFGGGFSHVFKGMDQGLEVAVKVLQVRSDNLQKMTRMFYRETIVWKFLQHPNVLPLRGVLKDRSQFKFAMVSEWMENGNINKFVRTHRSVNRYKLLADVSKGLIYLHSQGIIHGDIKGDNILIDESGNARVADFGLATISGPATTSSSVLGGSVHWMSPERFDPSISFNHSRPTQSSDCYALGMTVYEVLSGHIPFHRLHSLHVPITVLGGGRPLRPQGEEGRWFSRAVWDILELCWRREPSDRPSIESVFECLDRASELWTPFSLLAVGPQIEDWPPPSDPSTEGSMAMTHFSSTR